MLRQVIFRRCFQSLKSMRNKLDIFRVWIARGMLVALSIGNVVNVDSITVYKAAVFISPVLFFIWWIRSDRKFHWDDFFTCLVIIIIANLAVFGTVNNRHPVKDILRYTSRICVHGFFLFLLYNVVHGMREKVIDGLLAWVLYVSATINVSNASLIGQLLRRTWMS